VIFTARAKENKKPKQTEEDKEKNELKKLTRLELLELMYDQSKELDRLRAELEETKEKLAEKELQISEAGSLADAAVKISGVLEAAQNAADLYLQNIKRMGGTHEEE